MKKYRALMLYSDGSEEIIDEVFDTEGEAEEAALDIISCHKLGADILEMMGGEEGEIDYGEIDYEIIEEEE